MSREAFDAIDTDGDGYITASELLKSLAEKPNVSADEMATVVTMADADGDNKVSYDEYAKFVT